VLRCNIIWHFSSSFSNGNFTFSANETNDNNDDNNDEKLTKRRALRRENKQNRAAHLSLSFTRTHSMFSLFRQGSIRPKNQNKIRPLPMSYPKQHDNNTNSIYALLSWRGLLLTGSANGEINVWDPYTAQLVQKLHGHEEAVSSLCAFEDDYVASGSWDGTVRVWDTSLAQAVAVLTGHRKPISSLVSTLSGSLLCSGSWDGTVQCWNVRADRIQFTLNANGGSAVNCLTFFRDESMLVVGCGDGVLRVYSTQSGQKMNELSGGHHDTVRAVATFTNDNEHVFSAGKDGKIFAWSVDRGTATNIVGSSDLPPTSGMSSLGLDGVNANSNSNNNSYIAHDGGCCALQECGGGKLASAGYDGSVKIWDPDSRLFVAQLDAHVGEKVWALSYDERMLQLFSSGDKNIFAWDAATAFEEEEDSRDESEIDVEGRSMSVASRSASRADLPRVMSNVSNMSGGSASLANLHVHPNFAANTSGNNSLQGSYQNLSNLGIGQSASASASRRGSLTDLSGIVVSADVSGYNSQSSQPGSATKSGRRMKKSDVLRMELESANTQLESYAKAYEDQVQRYKDSEITNETLRKRITEQIAKLADAEKSKQELEARQSALLEEGMAQLRSEFEREKALALYATEKESKARFEVTIKEKENAVATLREELLQSNAKLEKERQETFSRLEALEGERSKSKLEADSLRQLNDRLLKEYKKSTTEGETQTNEEARTIKKLESEIESLKRDRAQFEINSKAAYEQIFARNEALDAEVSRLTGTLENASKTIDALKVDVQTASSQTNATRSELEASFAEREKVLRLEFESKTSERFEAIASEKSTLEEKLELLEDALKDTTESMQKEIEKANVDRESETSALKEALGDALRANEIANVEVANAIAAHHNAEMKFETETKKTQEREERMKQDLETKPDPAVVAVVEEENAALRKLDEEQKDKIAHLEAEYQRANERLREAEEDRRKERQGLESIAHDLEKKLEETREKRKEEMKESQAALRESKDRLQKADNDAHMLRSDLETAQKRLEDAIQNIDSTETSLESKYRQEIEKLELQAKTLQRELLDSKNETENALESASRAKTQLTDAKEKFAKAVSKGKGFQDQVSMLRETLEEVEVRSREAEREKRNAEAERERMLRDFEDAESREVRVKDALNHEKKRTASLKDELREATEKLVEFETLLEEETKKLGEVEAKVKAEEFAMERERANAKDAKRECDEMKIALKVAEKTVEEITTERDEVNVRLKETEVLLVESEKHVEDAETRVQEAKQSLTQLKASLDFANSRSKELEAKLVEAEEQDSPTRLSTADSAREESLNRTDALEMELGTSKRDLADANEKLKDSLERVVQLETEAKRRNEEYVAASNEVERLESAVNEAEMKISKLKTEIETSSKQQQQQLDSTAAVPYDNSIDAQTEDEKDAESRRVRWLEQQRLQAAESRAQNLEIELQQLRSEAEAARVAASEAWAVASQAGVSRQPDTGGGPESIAPSSPGGRSSFHPMASRSEYQFGGGGRQHQANDLASALEKQRYEMKIDALKVDAERLRRDRDRARRELERGKAAAKNAVAQVVERLRVEVHSRAIAERERDVLQSDLKRTMRQANDRLEQKTREAARAHEEFLDAKRKLEKLKQEKSLVSRAVEELHHNQDASATTAASTVTNPTSPRPPPGTKAATAYAVNHQQHAPSSSQTSVFVVTSEHVKILVGMILTMLFTVKFLNNGNVNGAAEL